MDWKIIAALVVAVAIVVSGFLASGGFDFSASPAPPQSQNPQTSNPLGPLGDFISGAQNAVSDIFGGAPQEKNVNRTLQVSGMLKLEDRAIKMNTPASSVEIEFDAQSSMNVGSEKINFSEGTKVSFGNFAGKLDFYANKTILLDGSAETIRVSNIGIVPHAQKTVSIKAAAGAKSAKIFNASADFNFNASGSLNLGAGKVAIKLENERLQIDNFKGDLSAAGSALALDGFSTKALVSGKEKVSVE